MMMMSDETPRSSPTVQVPPWDLLDDPTATIAPPFNVNVDSNSYNDALAALHRYLPSNAEDCDVPVGRVLVRVQEGASRTKGRRVDSCSTRRGRSGYLRPRRFILLPCRLLPNRRRCLPVGSTSLSELTASVRNLQIGSARMSMSPPSRGIQMGSGYCSPRSPSMLRHGFLSLPSTPTRRPARSGLGVFDLWDQTHEEEPVMERVESGKDLRAQIYAKLSKENSLDRADPAGPGPGPDLGWVWELVK
ncbi:hypothetical protein Acr_20g0003720 [Actinidia rufa]|uniref:Uncharacterized protein n=1 Tax=Actinidia rufa TaxID=165716 RepID=A0A7J0GCR0_9ERIC|nr:hypothetical protein Acr_20g0003720 [Actinidia rufa]